MSNFCVGPQGVVAEVVQGIEGGGEGLVQDLTHVDETETAALSEGEMTE